jgi:hypothetical protein
MTIDELKERLKTLRKLRRRSLQAGNIEYRLEEQKLREELLDIDLYLFWIYDMQDYGVLYNKDEL